MFDGLQNDLIIVFDTMKMLAHFVQIIILEQCYVKQIVMSYV
jgi:hypothetical protein